MFKLFVIAALSAVAYVNTKSYPAPKMTAGYGYGYGYAPIPLAVKSNHDVKYYDVPTTRMLKPVNVEIGAQPIPVNMLFKSASSALNVKQQHQGAPGSQQESKSEDEPHYLKHTVKKPILQEVVEVITPFRKITQKVEPVQEVIQTVVSRDAAGYPNEAYKGYEKEAKMEEAAYEKEAKKEAEYEKDAYMAAAGYDKDAYTGYPMVYEESSKYY